MTFYSVLNAVLRLKESKMRISKKKSFRVITKKNISVSPYWDFMASKCDDDGSIREYPEANPDVLDESAHLYFKQMNEGDNLRMDAVAAAWDKLSPQEKMLLELCGYEGKTIEHASIITKLSRGTIQDYLHRARVKIQRAYRRSKLKDRIAT
jgi:DNA-directed RNA polymerase specialized sigma24 family protein